MHEYVVDAVTQQINMRGCYSANDLSPEWAARMTALALSSKNVDAAEATVM